MTLEQFLTQYSQGYDHDGAYGEQCTDWFRGYCRFVLEIPQPSGVVGAYQFWDNRNTDISLKNNFTPIANTPSAIPQYGDVIVWKKTLNGNFGHVAICVDKSANVNKFVSSDQNWDGKSNASNKASTKPQLITHNYNHVAGFLRPKDQSKIIKQEQKEGEMSQINQYLDVSNDEEAKHKLREHLGEMNGKCGWGANKDMGYLGSERDRRAYFENLSVQLANEIDGYKGEINKLGYEVEELDKTNTKLEKDYNQMKAEVEYQNIKSTALQEDIEALNLEIKDLKKQAREKVCSLRESLLQFIDDIVERVKGAK